MTTYNTGNPLGSTDARDLYDNAQNLDNFANGANASYSDRFGATRRSLAGIEATADNVLNSIGYAVPVAYASGISLTLTSQTVEYNGEIYAPKSSALPFTTSSWGTDSTKFRLMIASDASRVNYTPSGAGAIATTVQNKLREYVSVKDFGAVGAGADESAAANAMIAAHNYLYVPQGFTLVCKNIQLNAKTIVKCDGTLKLPSGCSDFDRLLHAKDKHGIQIDINELDGNYAGQSGNIGTHLIYLVNCSDAHVNVKSGYNHYIASGATTPSVDGYRNPSSGAIFLTQCKRAIVNVDLFEGWGRECIYLSDCSFSIAGIGHAQGKYVTEYSGIQVGGFGNKITHASVDNAGASAVGFDTRYGNVSNVVATNTRAASGLNMGHPGRPATGSTATNIVVDGAYGGGISVSAGSIDVTVSNFYVKDVGDRGISWEGDTVRGKLSNGVIANSARWNMVTSNGVQIQTSNVTSSDKDPVTLLVGIVSGAFVDGEAVTASGRSATARRVLGNLTGTQQRIFLSDVVGTFTAGTTITGGTSGATGTINAVYVPVQYNEASGGMFVGDPRYYPGTGDQIRFPDGTAIYTRATAIVYATANTNQDLVIGFPSNVVWASAPTISAFVNSGSGASVYTINRLTGVTTTSGITLTLNASFAQTYGISVVAVGRWK